jgi:chromosome segregation ATPase
MLQVCGFGTEKWERLTATGFPAFRKLVDQFLEETDDDSDHSSNSNNGHISSVDIEAAVDEDIQRLMASQPEIFEDFVQRFDPDTGMFIPTEEELKSSLAYRRQAERLEKARHELKKFRKGGSKALERMQRLEKKIAMLERALAQRPSESERDASIDIPAGYDIDDAGDITEGLFDAPEDSGNGHSLFEDEVTTLEDAGIEDLGGASGLQDSAAAVELAQELEELKREIQAKNHNIESLERTVADLQEQAQQTASSAAELREVRRQAEVAAEEAQQQIDQLQKDVKTREHTIEGLKEDQEGLETRLETAIRAQAESSGEEDAAAEAAERFKENQELRKDLRAREHTIEGLKRQLEQFEEDLIRARDQLMAEVQRLKELTSGDVEIRPSEELEEMDSNQLLHYARDVAEDLDVRRQTLDEGLSGIDTIKDSFEENKKVYEEQQQQMTEQMEQLHKEMEELEKEREAQKATESKPDATAEETRDVIAQQRQQLELLSTRIRQLAATKTELEEANKKTYSDLEASVRRLAPLRKQIEELDSLRDTLSAYIREKYDRTFTVRKLDGGG